MFRVCPGGAEDLEAGEQGPDQAQSKDGEPEERAAHSLEKLGELPGIRILQTREVGNVPGKEPGDRDRGDSQTNERERELEVAAPLARRQGTASGQGKVAGETAPGGLPANRPRVCEGQRYLHRQTSARQRTLAK